MKNQWNQFKLREILTLQYGKGLPENKRISGKHPVYGSGGIVGYHNESLIKGPGIIVGRKGSIGSVFYEKKDFYPIDTVFYVELKSSEFNLRYIYYMLMQSNVKNLNTDAAVPGLNREVAHSQIVKVPEFLFQQKISSILSAYDDLIENNTRRIQILEEMAQRIYREWFVDFRFPGHKKVKFVDSEMGKIPEGWAISNLEQIAELVKDKFHENQHSNLPLLDLARIPRKSLAISEFGKSDEIKTSRIVFKEGNILFGAIRPYFHKIILAPCDGVTNVSVFVLKNKDIVGKHYLFNLLFSDEVVAWANQYSGGTKMPVINWEVFKTMKIVIPQRGIILDFESMVNNIFNLIKVLNLKNITLKRNRDLLLPKLISGELDVSDLDIKIIEEK